MENRVNDWTLELNMEVKRARDLDHRFGNNDFFIFTLRVVDQIAETDMAPNFRCEYDSFSGLMGIARDICGDGASIEDLISETMEGSGFSSGENPWLSQRGDVGVFPCGEYGIVSGICMGAQYYTLSPEGQFKGFAIDSVANYWKVR